MEQQRVSGPTVELSGNRRAVVDGCDGILEYEGRPGGIPGGQADPVFHRPGAEACKAYRYGSGDRGRHPAGGVPVWGGPFPQPEKGEGGAAMMERLAHFLTGWVEFEARGNGPRSSTPPPVLGWSLWGFRREEGCLVLRGKARQYGCLRPLFRRCGDPPQASLPGRAALFHRPPMASKGLAVGSLLGVGVYLFLSGFCWGRHGDRCGNLAGLPSAGSCRAARGVPGGVPQRAGCEGSGFGHPK